MIRQHALVEPRMEATTVEIRHDREVRGTRTGSRESGSIRSAVARVIVLAGARIHGSAPAVIGGRVASLDQHGDEEFQPAI